MDNTKYRELDDLSWYLLAEDEDFTLTDCVEKPCIVFWHKAGESKLICRINVFCPINKTPLISELVPFLSVYADCDFISKQQSPCYHSSLQVTPSNEHGNEGVQLVISELFSTLLITGRPLRFYNCTFYLPLDLLLDSEIAMTSNSAKYAFKEGSRIERYKVQPPSSLLNLDKGTDDEDRIAHAQAHEFFFTHIEDQLFETDNCQESKNIKPIIHRRLRHDTLESLSISLQDENRTTSAQVKDVSMYEYYNGMLLLGIQVALPMNNALLSAQDDDLWWEPLIYSKSEVWETLEILQVEYWLRYTKLARILYANFFEQLKEFKIAPVWLCSDCKPIENTSLKAPFSSIVLYFISEFLDIGNGELVRDKRLKQIADERMFVHVTYALMGNIPKLYTPAYKQFERLFCYALYVDQRTDGYAAAEEWPYDKEYIQSLMESQTIKRWQSISNLSGYTDYSTVFMGFGSFFQNPVSSVHVPYIYAKIQIQVLFYKLTLQHLDRCISRATSKLIKRKARSNEFSQLRLGLINFTNNYWFRELTPQIQGKEITVKMMQQQGLDERYALIKDKLERASDYSTTLKDFWLQEKAVFVGWVAAIFALLTFSPPIFDAIFDSTDYAGGSIAAVVIIFATIIGFAVWKLVNNLYSLFKNKVTKDECTKT